MEKYFAAKRLLFDGTVYPAPRVAVINAQDDRAKQLAAAARTSRRGSPHLWHWRGRLARREATRSLLAERFSSWKPPQATAQVTSRLAGEVNIFNLLAAFTAAHARGVPFDATCRVGAAARPVPGRFQPVDAGQPFTVIVDYAHTDDALRNLIALARQMTASPAAA